jgi:hypothetical protein
MDAEKKARVLVTRALVGLVAGSVTKSKRGIQGGPQRRSVCRSERGAARSCPTIAVLEMLREDSEPPRFFRRLVM